MTIQKICENVKEDVTDATDATDNVCVKHSIECKICQIERRKDAYFAILGVSLMVFLDVFHNFWV